MLAGKCFVPNCLELYFSLLYYTQFCVSIFHIVTFTQLTKAFYTQCRLSMPITTAPVKAIGVHKYTHIYWTDASSLRKLLSLASFSIKYGVFFNDIGGRRIAWWQAITAAYGHTLPQRRYNKCVAGLRWMSRVIGSIIGGGDGVFISTFLTHPVKHSASVNPGVRPWYSSGQAVPFVLKHGSTTAY